MILSLRVAPPGILAPWQTLAAERPFRRTWHVPHRPFCNGTSQAGSTWSEGKRWHAMRAIASLACALTHLAVELDPHASFGDDLPDRLSLLCLREQDSIRRTAAERHTLL